MNRRFLGPLSSRALALAVGLALGVGEASASGKEEGGKADLAALAEAGPVVHGLPCTEYVAGKLAAAGYELKTELPTPAGGKASVRDVININPRALAVKDNADLDRLVRAGNEMTKGVVAALVLSGQGREIKIAGSLASLRRGDVVQYWYVENGARRGHTAIVTARCDADGMITLRGSQNGKEGGFKTALGATDFRYAVRPGKPKAAPGARKR